MSNKFFLFQTPDERLADLNDWAARDYANVKLVDALAGDAEAQARKRAETLGLPPDSEATQAELDRVRSALSAIQGAFAKNDIDAGLALHGRAANELEHDRFSRNLLCWGRATPVARLLMLSGPRTSRSAS